jgi:hypothetical protein
MRWALYVTLSAAWLDPAEVVGQNLAVVGAEPLDDVRLKKN